MITLSKQGKRDHYYSDKKGVDTHTFDKQKTEDYMPNTEKKQLKHRTSTPERDQLNFGKYDFLRDLFRILSNFWLFWVINFLKIF